MKTIWKFPIHPTDHGLVWLPKDAKILSVISQHGDDITLYAMVDDQKTMKEERHFWVCGTGHNTDGVPASAQFLGTVSLMGGKLIFHVFIQ